MRTQRYTRITPIRFEPEAYARLAELADRRGTTVSEVLRDAADVFVTDHGRELVAS